MTRTLEEAFAEAAKLSEREQEALGNWLLAEIESDRIWEETFSRSQNFLASLAKNALEEHRSGRTEVLDPEKL